MLAKARRRRRLEVLRGQEFGQGLIVWHPEDKPRSSSTRQPLGAEGPSAASGGDIEPVEGVDQE